MTEMLRSGMVQYHPSLSDLMVPIDSIGQHPDNPNNGDVELLVQSIEVNGMYRPVYVQEGSGHILAGNTTWEACLALGAEEIPVVWLDIDDDSARRVLLADNRIARLAVSDLAAELSMLEQIADTDSLLGTGYIEADLRALRRLSEIHDDQADFATWPTITVRVPPHVRKAYMRITDIAVGDRERFELLLRLAGWNGEEV